MRGKFVVKVKEGQFYFYNEKTGESGYKDVLIETKDFFEALQAFIDEVDSFDYRGGSKVTFIFEPKKGKKNAKDY